MTGAFSGSPLTVWVGPMRYIFHPGRDVIVGFGNQCDVPLDRPGNPASISQTARPVLVLRFSGTHWVAIEKSPDGVFVDGIRMSTIDVRDGQAITIGDPRRGPRLILGVGPAVPPPAADPPPRPNPHAPTQSTTQRMRLPTSQPSPSGVERPLPPVASAPPTAPIPAPVRERPESQRLIERISTHEAARRFFSRAPGRGTEHDEPVAIVPVSKPGARTVGVAAHWLGLTADGHELLTKVSFTARPGTMTAVVGPSAASNSALLGLLAGAREPTFGTVTVDEHDVHAEPGLMRARIGIVSADDRAHPSLTVERAVGYAAQLRLPPDTSAEHRNRVVDQVLDELGLSPHRGTRMGKLAPEMRRLASMAIELITRPTLLVVDELSAGLDAAQEHHVLAALRRQADLGCVVVVALTSQTSLTHLNICDQVLLLTPAGRLAFAGPPAQIESAMGTADWSQVVAQVSADPDGAQQALTAPPPVAEPAPPSWGLAVSQQIRVVARRQFRLLLANRVYFLFLVLLPFALAGLTLLIPGHSGLDRAGPKSAQPA